jgi:hypothetical protein
MRSLEGDAEARRRRQASWERDKMRAELDRDRIVPAAEAMIRNHGRNAEVIALKRAENLEGSESGNHWAQVARAIRARKEQTSSSG